MIYCIMEFWEKVKAIKEVSGVIFGGGFIAISGWLIDRYRKYKAVKKEKMLAAAAKLEEDRLFREKMNKMFDKVENMDKQLRPNSGTSVFDMVGTLVAGQARLEAKVDLYQDRQRFSANMQAIAFWTTNETSEFDYVSPALCKMVDRSESEMEGNGWQSWIAKADMVRIIKSWHYSIRDKRAFDEIFSFIDRNDKEIKVSAMAFHSYDKVTNKYISTYGTLEKIE